LIILGGLSELTAAIAEEGATSGAPSTSGSQRLVALLGTSSQPPD
jgi:hypothetical protein